jgi:hypothetical protein
MTGELVMAKKPSKDIFSGEMSDWELVPKRKAGRSDYASDQPPSKPDRVAKEQREVVEKYLGDNAAKRTGKPLGNPHADAGVEHSTLIRAKKKGAVDSEADAKTMVVRNNKIIGVQG